MLDLDALDRNIARMAAYAQARGLRLRPHAKTHKCRQVAELQAQAGAAGICCATLYEAEQLAGSASTILLTSPVGGHDAIERIAALASRTDLTVVVDHPVPVAALAGAAFNMPRLDVIVDVDTGMGRTGVASPERAVMLAGAIAAAPRLRYAGIQFYCGAEQHIRGFDDRRAALAARNHRLSATIGALVEAGLAPAIVTGGGTGSHAIDADSGLLTELQPGSYVFMDQDYGACDLRGAGPFEAALSVHATVVSANHARWVTIDAGIKALATDSGQPMVLHGAPPGSTYGFTGDEFGRIDVPAGAPLPAWGTRVVLMPSHCDPTVNLHDGFYLERGGVRAGIWNIGARGYVL